MSKNYRAKVHFDLSAAPRREYRRMLDVVSDTLLKRPETADTLIFGSEKDGSIDLVMRVESSSSSSASSKIDTFIRRIIYAIDPHSGVRTHGTSGISTEHVTKELTAA